MTWHLGVCAADSGAALQARAAALRRRLRLSTCDRLRSWVSRHDGPGDRDGTLPPGGLEGIIAGRCFLSSRDHDGARRRCSRCRLGHRRLGMAGKQGDGHGGKDASQEAGVGFRGNGVTGAAPRNLPWIRPRVLNIRDVSLFVDVVGHGCPVVLMHGGPSADHFTLLPFHQGQLAAGIPYPHLQIVERAGHDPCSERPAEVMAPIRFHWRGRGGDRTVAAPSSAAGVQARSAHCYGLVPRSPRDVWNQSTGEE
jgi:pimeloyl-ACP methyl ester carboxylesterase